MMKRIDPTATLREDYEEIDLNDGFCIANCDNFNSGLTIGTGL